MSIQAASATNLKANEGLENLNLSDEEENDSTLNIEDQRAALDYYAMQAFQSRVTQSKPNELQPSGNGISDLYEPIQDFGVENKNGH